MKQEIPTWLGILSLVAVAALGAFVVFGLRQGSKVKRPPEGVPPERFH